MSIYLINFNSVLFNDLVISYVSKVLLFSVVYCDIISFLYFLSDSYIIISFNLQIVNGFMWQKEAWEIKKFRRCLSTSDYYE